jgi:glycosyltransferase involved in cell wall biosynthesis
MLTLMQVTPALETGGVERTTLEVADAVVRAGGRCFVASRGGRMAKELADLGGVLIPMPLETKNPLGIRMNAGRIAAAARDRGVELIHARSRAPGWSAYWAAKRLNLPFVTTYHGIYNGRTPWKRAYNAIMAKGDTVIANSYFTRDHILREHRIDPARVVAIPRGVDLHKFDPARITQERIARVRAAMGATPGSAETLIVLPARLTHWKGQTVFLQAAAKVARNRPGAARFVLAGDAQGRDAYVQELESLIRSSGLSQWAGLAGHVEDMPAALAVADIAVFPSLEPEAFGRGCVEAQAMGTPVIAADHGGLSETVRHGESGFLVPPGNIEALAMAMDKLIEIGPQERKRLGAQGATRVRATYSTESLQRATLEVYARLLEAKR